MEGVSGKSEVAPQKTKVARSEGDLIVDKRRETSWSPGRVVSV